MSETANYRDKPSDVPYKVTKWIDVWDRIKVEALKLLVGGVALLSVVGMGNWAVKCHDENVVENKRVYECKLACLPDKSHTRYGNCMCSKMSPGGYHYMGPAYKPDMEKFSVPK